MRVRNEPFTKNNVSVRRILFTYTGHAQPSPSYAQSCSAIKYHGQTSNTVVDHGFPSWTALYMINR